MCKITKYQKLNIELGEAEQKLADLKSAYMRNKTPENREAMTTAQVIVRTLDLRAGAIFAKLQKIAQTEIRLWNAGEGERWIDGEGVYHYGYPEGYNWHIGEYDRYEILCVEFGWTPTVGRPRVDMLTWGEEEYGK